MTTFVFPCRVVAPDFDAAVAEVLKLMQAKNTTPLQEILPYMAQVQSFEQPWWEAYTLVSGE